jgi:hypothetical protein
MRTGKITWKKKYESQFPVNNMLNEEIKKKLKKKINLSLSKPTHQIYNLVMEPR